MRQQTIKLLSLTFVLMFSTASIGQRMTEVKDKLGKTYPSDSIKGDDIWVYYNDYKIEKVKHRLFKKLLPNVTFYKSTFTHYLGHHIEDVECIFLYDKNSLEVVIYPPIDYYDGILDDLFGRLSIVKFITKQEKNNLVKGIRDLILLSTPYMQIKNVEIDENLITFDLYRSNGRKVSLYRKMTLEFLDDKIYKFISLNPSTGKKKYYMPEL